MGRRDSRSSGTHWQKHYLLLRRNFIPIILACQAWESAYESFASDNQSVVTHAQGNVALTLYTVVFNAKIG